MTDWLSLAVRVLIACTALFTLGALASVIATFYARRGTFDEELFVSKGTVHDIERRERRSRDARV